MTVVRYCCPFVPVEWIDAHGLRPSRVVPTPARSHCPDGACPYAYAFMEMSNSMANAPFIFTTTCDQMRRHAELAHNNTTSSVFLMHVPTTWQTPGSFQLYRDELERLGRFLCQLGGVTPSKETLENTIRVWESRRNSMRLLRDSANPADWPEMLRRFHEDGHVSDVRTADDQGLNTDKGVPLALVGSPLLASHLSIHSIIAQFGGRVVLDGTDFGERAFPVLDHKLLVEDPLNALADAYFHSIPDAFRRTNEMLYEWVIDGCSRARARGVVFHHQLWCDTWHGEAQRMRERLSLPFLSLETGGESELGAHAISRLQAFLENLK